MVMDKDKKCYSCKICNTEYASCQSLWNHKNKYHNDLFFCEYCKKGFTRKFNLQKHHETCKIKQKKELEKLKLEVSSLQKQKIDLQNQKNNDIKKLNSFHELNKKLKQQSYYINQQNSTNQIHSNNIITNSNNNTQYITNFIIKFGDEDLSSRLSIEEKEFIIRNKFFSIEKMVELTNCGKYNEFKNIIITNMKNNIAYVYNDKGYFEAMDCNEALMRLLNNRIMVLEQTLEDVINSKNVSPQMKKSVTKFIDELQTDENKETEKNKIKFILYNNTFKITNDLMTAIDPSGNELLENTIIETIEN
jgi:hypothetical protein